MSCSKKCRALSELFLFSAHSKNTSQSIYKADRQKGREREKLSLLPLLSDRWLNLSAHFPIVFCFGWLLSLRNTLSDTLVVSLIHLRDTNEFLLRIFPRSSFSIHLNFLMLFLLLCFFIYPCLLFCLFLLRSLPLPHRDEQCRWVSLSPYCPAQKSQSVFNELCVCGSQPGAAHYWPVGICFSLPSPVCLLLLYSLSLPIYRSSFRLEIQMEALLMVATEHFHWKQLLTSHLSQAAQ